MNGYFDDWAGTLRPTIWPSVVVFGRFVMREECNLSES
jgi:hypothetical protein